MNENLNLEKFLKDFKELLESHKIDTFAVLIPSEDTNIALHKIYCSHEAYSLLGLAEIAKSRIIQWLNDAMRETENSFH